MNKLVILIAVALGWVPLSSFGEGFANNLLVDYVRADKSGFGFVQFTTALSNTPAECASTYPQALSFDIATAGGKAVYALVLSAKVTGKRIYAKGTGACSQYGVVESWNWGRIID